MVSALAPGLSLNYCMQFDLQSHLPEREEMKYSWTVPLASVPIASVPSGQGLTGDRYLEHSRGLVLPALLWPLQIHRASIPCHLAAAILCPTSRKAVSGAQTPAALTGGAVEQLFLRAVVREEATGWRRLLEEQTLSAAPASFVSWAEFNLLSELLHSQGLLRNVEERPVF